MSTTATVRTTTTSAKAPRRPATPAPALRLVSPAVRRGSSVPFVMLCSFLLVAGLIAALLLNMSLAQGSYAMDSLQKRSALAADREAALRQDLAAESAPGRLAQKATALGMVPNTTAVFLSLPDGRVLGVAPKGGATKPLKVVVDQPPAAPAPAATAPPGGAAPTPTQGR